MNQDKAVESVINALMKEGILSHTTTSYGRHHIIRTKKDTYYIIYKREWFMTFQKIYPTQTGVGESINQEALQEAINNNATLLFVHPMATYTIYPLTVKNYCERHNLIRVQDRKNIYKIGDYKHSIEVTRERTYSFPSLLLRRWRGSE